MLYQYTSKLSPLQEHTRSLFLISHVKNLFVAQFDAVPTETSPNKRAGCQATECKQAGIKIQVGELRFGTFVTIMASDPMIIGRNNLLILTQEHQSWRWKHWSTLLHPIWSLS